MENRDISSSSQSIVIFHHKSPEYTLYVQLYMLKHNFYSTSVAILYVHCGFTKLKMSIEESVVKMQLLNRYKAISLMTAPGPGDRIYVHRKLAPWPTYGCFLL